MLHVRPSAALLLGVLFLGSLSLAACRQTGAPDVASPALATTPPGPAQTIERLTAHLRRNDFEGFAREAVPPPLHDRLDAAWRAGRTRWPLDELPFGVHLPGMLQALAAPGSETRLQAVFDHQFAGADRQLHGAAVSLGLFGTQYLQTAGGYGDAERQHYAQLIQAAAGWSTHAPLGDRGRARQGLSTLAAAARRTGLAAPGAFPRLGMDEGLRRVGPFAAALKQAIAGYGLDLDADLATLHATLVQQTGDTARVRMRYRFAGADIDTVVPMQRIDGRWYLVEFLRHGETAAASGTAARPRPAHLADARSAAAAR
jgi:hypothetical protein